MQQNQPAVKKEIPIGYGVKANIVRQGSVVTFSLIRGIHSVVEGEHRELDEKIPNGFKPCVQTHLIVNKNVANQHKECAVWHLEPDGSMYFSNPSLEMQSTQGQSLTSLEDEYPTIEE